MLEKHLVVSRLGELHAHADVQRLALARSRNTYDLLIGIRAQALLTADVAHGCHVKRSYVNDGAFKSVSLWTVLSVRYPDHKCAGDRQEWQYCEQITGDWEDAPSSSNTTSAPDKIAASSIKRMLHALRRTSRQLWTSCIIFVGDVFGLLTLGRRADLM